MVIAALYDIHGNLPALRAVLAEAAVEGAEKFVIGGDVASGPLPRETIDQLMALGERAGFVRGNADREAVDAYDAGRTKLGGEDDPAGRAAIFVASQISKAQRDFLAGFAQTVRLDLDGLGPTLFCHGSPRSDSEIITRLTSDERLHAILSGVDERVIVGGHTHQQFDRAIEGRRLINAGSVGIPYEGRPGAYWALLGRDVELRRTEYDLDAAVGELRAGGFPDLHELLNESLLDPIDPREVSELFERQAQSGQSAGTDR
jgi:predicted phosphodiesterase